MKSVILFLLFASQVVLAQISCHELLNQKDFKLEALVNLFVELQYGVQSYDQGIQKQLMVDLEDQLTLMRQERPDLYLEFQNQVAAKSTEIKQNPKPKNETKAREKALKEIKVLRPELILEMGKSPTAGNSVVEPQFIPHSNLILLPEMDRLTFYNSQTLRAEMPLYIGSLPRFASVDPANGTALSGNGTSKLNFFDFKNRSALKNLFQSDRIIDAALSSDGQTAYLLTETNTLQAIEFGTQKLLWKTEFKGVAKKLYVSLDDRFVISLDKKAAHVVDANDGKSLFKTTHEAFDVRGGFSQNSDFFFYYADDGIARVIDLTSLQLRALEKISVQSFVISQDGKRIFASAGNKTLELDSQTLQSHKTIQHEGSVTRTSLSPDGTILAAGMSNGTIVFTETATLNDSGLLELSGAVNGLQFSADGKLLLVTTNEKRNLYRVFETVEGLK